LPLTAPIHTLVLKLIMEEEHQSVGDDADIEESTNVQITNIEITPPSKPKLAVIKRMEEGLTMSNQSGMVDAPSISSAHTETKKGDMNMSSNGTDMTSNESSLSKPKSKGTKKKKKKVSRNHDSNITEISTVSIEQSDDKSGNGIETTTVLSTTSSTLKSKVPKKKKKKMNVNDDYESTDILSVSSNKSGYECRNKSSPRKKKKKKKISKDDVVGDVTPDCSARSLMTSSVKSTSKTKTKSIKSPKSPKSLKSKKKKAKSSNENNSTIPNIERTKSLEPGLLTNPNEKRTKNLDPEQSSSSTIKRSMSLDVSNNQFRPALSMPISRLNSQRENGMNANSWTGRGRPHGGRGRGPLVAGRGRGRGRGAPQGIWGASRPQKPPERIQNGERMIEGRSYSQERTPYGVRSLSQERMNYCRSASQERSPYGARSASQERSPYGARGLSQDTSSYNGRSPSQERSPYGATRGINGRGLGPAPRGRRRMSFPPPSTYDENPTLPPKQSRGNLHLQSTPSRGNIYRAPSRPKSILRNSSHHGMLHGSSHHRNDRSIATSSSHSSSQYNPRRVSMDLNAGSRHSTRSYNKYDPHSSFGSEIDSSDVESDDEDDSSFALEDSGKKSQKQVPRTVVRGYSRTLSGLGTNSSHHGLSYLKSTGQSARSLLTIERSEYQNENRFLRGLRYIHFLAPHPNEDPIKKKIRIVTWIALFLDFLNALGEPNEQTLAFSLR